MGYRFPLAAVLQVRKLALEHEERTLTRILGELAQLRAALVRAETDLCQGGSARYQAFSQLPLPAMHLHASYAAETDLREHIRRINQQLTAFEELRLQQIAIYQDAYRRREVLASLEKAGHEAWRLAEARAEAKRSDDAFLARIGQDTRKQADEDNADGQEIGR